MKVAIIGGGLSGVVCALQLQRYGVMADIFERNKKVAEPYRHVGAALEIALRPIKDPLEYLNEKYNIFLKSSGLVNKVIHNGPSTSSTITGNLGYFLIRGNHPASLVNHLIKDFKGKVYLSKEVDYKDLKKVYDLVIVASGYPTEAKDLGIWNDIIKMSVKGAVIDGNFDSDTFIVWINKDYCKSGYAYLSPFNNKEASLVLAVNDIQLDEIEKYWKKFIESEKLNYKVKESFKRVHYAGFMYPHKVDNVYFVGNASGCLDPLLGFGAFSCVVTASEAAKSIVYGTDYELAIKSVIDSNLKMLEFRKVFNKLNNKDYDLLIRSLGLPGINSLFYKWSKINVVNMGYSASKLLNKLLSDKT
ncbi:UNVERIFIED_CONTAM: flavin-dependent dehydrogenase [Acetivibrio alkalicellulosi]